MAFSTITTGAIALGLAAMAFLFYTMRVKVDPREPPVVHPTVPFFGHLIGMLTEGPLYLKRVSERYKYPIFTLPMLNGKTYVVTAPTLAVAVQRASSTLDFDQLVVEMTPRLVGSSPEVKHIIEDPTAKQEGRTRLVTRFHAAINPQLAAHRILDVTQMQMDHFASYFNNISEGQELDLYKSVTREVTNASMYTFYGPHNPFAVDPDLVEKYWDWDDGNVGYAVGLFPKYTARKAYLGIEACVNGFHEYTKKGLHDEAVAFIKSRRDMHFEDGISPYEHARLEMGMAFAFNSNASITTFWVLNNISSRPDLLSEIRNEIQGNAFHAPDTISAADLRDKCPLLNSVWRETMRLIAPMTSARIVLEDTILADTYLLRKGSVVQIAGGVLHSDTEIWGPDASSFNARRFYHHANGTKTNASGNIVDEKASVVHPAAWRAFGGGVSLCPGRHFAQLEVVSLVAVYVMGFELQPVGGKVGEWDPIRDDKRFPLAVTKPVGDVRVQASRRRGFEDVKWVLKA
ncbi:cytochrome P450 [Paraphoma chrysanthemicola]|nr:cytochrome P450 [Paraphoma chrysanthemicola]